MELAIKLAIAYLAEAHKVLTDHNGLSRYAEQVDGITDELAKELRALIN